MSERRRETVLVDMDGVLADFDGATESYLKDYHPHISIVAERQHFYFRNDYPDISHQAIIDELHASQHFFASLPPVHGAFEGWEKLHELGYEPQICSSPLRTNEWCKEEKIDWIRRHLGPSAARSAIIDSAKENYDGIALVDDRPTVKNTDQASWQHVVFDRSYNRGVEVEFRIVGWNDPHIAETLARIERS